MATDRFSDLRHSISESAAAVVDHDGHRGGTPAIWPMAGAGRLQPGASALREQPRIIAWPGAGEGVGRGPTPRYLEAV